jgi:hypothetical protein
MLGAFGQIPINDSMIGKMASGESGHVLGAQAQHFADISKLHDVGLPKISLCHRR